MSVYWRLLCLSIAWFGAVPISGAEIDPPGRVGRISLADEGAQLRMGDAVVTGRAALNWPLTTGALIETAGEARAEARIGSTTLHLDGGSSLEFVELSDERIWIRLNRGSVVLGIQNPEHAAELALDTPQGRLRIGAPGRYRADVAGGTTAFSSYQGTAHIEDIGLALRPGDRILLMGGFDRRHLLGNAANDAFMHWSLTRDQLAVRGGTRYISPEMTGHEDLERYGHWQETSEYGSAWFPRGISPGWAPYRHGRWAWVSPWGWTWIDHAPWGFAPFHYGRWALIGNNWAWLPGAYATRPIYAPALIVWLGQPGWNASFSFGSAPAAGWFPLGPREIYYPHYRSSLRHVRSINATHVHHVTRINSVAPPQRHDRHIHRDRHEAVTVVPAKTVESGTPVHQTFTAQDRRSLATVPVAAHQPQEAPRQDRRSIGAVAAPQESGGLPSGRSLIAPHRRNDNSHSLDGHLPLPRNRANNASAPLLPRNGPAQPVAEAVPPPARSMTPPPPPADSVPISRLPANHEPPPHPRRMEFRPMPDKTPAAASLPAPQKTAPTVEAGRHHGSRADHGKAQGESHKPREPRYREQPSPKQGPLDR